ncbi:MAG: alpha-glucosidase [Bacteroidetes bacterium HGW-Bacteroidetes-4]|nr:MAG: alpha-glucosidase [Bacteroidetes bacterium HGW-Bacteroidetes-4]
MSLTWLAFSFTACQKNQIMELKSPDKELTLTVSLGDSGQLFYQVWYQQKQVLKPSLLGIERHDAGFSKNLNWQGVSEPRLINDSYTLPVHKKEQYTYTAVEQSILVKNTNNEPMEVIFRVSDHGLAFQYHFPNTDSTLKIITLEHTTFTFDKNARSWLQPMAKAKTGWGECNPSYEEHYLQNNPVGLSSPMEGWVFPALFKTGETWVLISETAVDRAYCASHLTTETSDGAYKIAFPDPQEVIFTGELNPQSTLPWKSPWRIIAVGSLANITESTLGTDLAKPAANKDFSWVKPGRASWSWVLLKDNKTIYPVQKEFIDYAADMGWEYCLIDAGWDLQIGYQKIQELTEYARSKNVLILLWYNSAGDWNSTPQTPKNALLTRADRIKEFTRIKEMGIAGVKVDFFGGDGQSVINYYIDILEDAARVGLMVNFHGCTLPRGWHRTYPNLLTMEAIRGMEFATFTQDDANLLPGHCATIPFTRNVFDPMDFTPTCFGEIDNINRVTTNGFELALAVLFQSGIQHYAEIPNVMNAAPVYVKELMKNIPVVWDETRFIDGFPGEYVLMARRTGKTWYIAGINGQDAAKSIQLDLAFTRSNSANLITDGSNNRNFSFSVINEPGKKTVDINLQAHGGFLIQTTE